MLKRKVLSMLVLVMFLTGILDFSGFNAIKANASITNFITRSGDKLMDGFNEFRFISVNIPNLTVLEDPSWHRADPWEIEDALKSVSQLGGVAVRVMPPSVTKATDLPGMARHITGIRTYDENLWRDTDKVLQLANQYGIRIIFPLIDEWTYWGGKDAFAALRGTTDFYGDAAVKQDFKNYIYDLLNRTNYYTGVQYKNDKSILCWETGNELSAPDAWTSEMAAYIKSIDSNHLVMDGHYGIASNSLNNPNIDIVTNHYYPGSGADFSARCTSDRNASAGKRPFIIGEFGNTTTSTFSSLLDTVISNGTSGALIWSLRYHNKEGGFYIHNEGNGFSSYHWPGFAENNGWDEINVLNMLKSRAYQIRGLPVPALPVPDAPAMLAPVTANELFWKGSAGASSYTVERSTSSSGPWTPVGSGISDSVNNYAQPLFSDGSAAANTDYYYRVKAANSSGISGASNVVGPVRASNSSLISNSSFENGTASWSLGAHWSVTNTDSYSGNYSVASNGNGDWCNLTQTIPVTPYTNYVFSFYGKCSSSTAYKVCDSTLTPVTADFHTKSNNLWTKYSIKFNSGSRTSVAVLVSDGGTGVNFFDNFEVKRYVNNEGFENGVNGWKMDSHWTVTSSDKRSGSFSAMLNGNGDWCNLIQTVYVEPYTDYQFSFYGKCTSGNLVYKVYDELQSQALTKDMHTTNNGLWTKYSVDFNSGSNSSVKILISDGGSGVSYFDDFAVEPLVANGDFETKSEPWIFDASFSLTTADKHSGASSIKVGGTARWDRLYQTVPVTPNTDYVFTFYGKCTSNNIVYKISDTSWNNISGDYHTENNNTWTAYKIPFNSGNRNSVNIAVSDGSSTISYLDDFSVTPAYIKNAGFENGTSNWTLGSAHWEITTVEKIGGSNSIKLTGTGDWCALYQDVSVKRNQDYILYFYGKCTSSNIVYKISDTSWNPVTSDHHTANNNAWTLYSLSFNSGNRDEVRIYLGDGANSTNYFDDFRIVPSPIVNPGFENSVLSWQCNNMWNKSGTDKYKGAYSLNLNGTGSNGNAASVFKVNTDTLYKVTFYHKGAANVSYRITDPAWNTLTSFYTTGNDADWTEYSIWVNSGTLETIQIIFMDVGTGTSYIDEVRVE